MASPAWQWKALANGGKFDERPDDPEIRQRMRVDVGEHALVFRPHVLRPLCA